MDEEAKRVVGRPFEPGNAGKPKGARNKLGESFVKAVLDDFNEHGLSAIAKVRTDDPSTYMRVIASLLPKEVTGADGEPLVPPSLTIALIAPKVGGAA